jgi:hypothetical protein
MDGLDQPTVVVTDDQPDAVQAALDERADEARPGAALVVAGGQLEAEDAPLTRGGHAGCHQSGHGHHPPALAHLDVGRIEPQVGIGLVGQRAAAEGGHLGTPSRSTSTSPSAIALRTVSSSAMLSLAIVVPSVSWGC